MSRLTRAFVVLATIGTAAVTAYIASGMFTFLVWLSLLAGLITGAASRLSRRLGLLFPMLFAYISPVAFLLWRGNHHYTFALVWISALLGVIVVRTATEPWALPRGWRWPIALWAMIIAASWPIVAWRELDFTLALLWADRLPVTTIKLSGAATAGWTAFTALTQLTGILWIDWLFREYAWRDPGRFRREIVWPLGFSAALGGVVALYQGFFDIGFLSGHIWPSIRRASGTLMDGNAFGMLEALWAPAFLVLGIGTGLAGSLTAALGFGLAWGGVWMSGSRTAFLAASVGTLWAVLESPRFLPSVGLRRRWVTIAVVAMVIVFGVVAGLPTENRNAVERARDLVPSTTLSSAAKTARGLLWERSGYGQASMEMISEYPWLGVGLGSYHILIRDWARVSLGVLIPADNAQNWFRHQLVELGILGSIGWLAWVAVFGASLWPRRAMTVGPGVALRGALVGFALASLLGMPAQDPAVALTFWLLVFWYATDRKVEPATGRGSMLGWVVILAVVAGYTVARAVPNDLRPPFRAARYGFPYAYGVDFENPSQVWTAKHGVTVLDATANWLKLTVWVDHPDADKRPVKVDVWKDHDHVINERIFLGQRVTRLIRVGRGQRFVLEAEVDRTFRPSDFGRSVDPRDLGLAMKWEFADAP